MCLKAAKLLPMGVCQRSKDGLPKVKNDVNLPNFIAKSKQKDIGAKQNGHKKAKAGAKVKC
jgi:hypothetical protein